VLVTGDVSHHRAVSAVDQGLSIIDAGHIPTERPGMMALRAALGRELGADPIDLTRVEADPWA
jgi:putative NIF3 family GTP cyclohydrolase 1 type 2